MNVRELIEALMELDPELPVWHDGGGDPYNANEIRWALVTRPPEPGMKMLGHPDDTPDVWVELS